MNNYGLNDNYLYLEFELDSLDATNTGGTPQLVGGGTNITDWPKFELGRPLVNVAAVKILEVEIPFSYYVFNEGNNTFLLSESTGVTNSVVIIPTGNYTTSNIIGVLQAALVAASGHPGRTYTVTYDSIKQKFSFSNNAGFTNTFTFTFGTSSDSGQNNPRLWLGFPAGSTTSATNQFMVAPNVQQITGPNYLYLNSDTIGTMCPIYLPAGAVNLGRGIIGPQIAKIPVNVNPNGIIVWQDPDPQKWFDLQNLSNFPFIDFYLTPGNSGIKPLALNGQSFSLKFGVLVNAETTTDTQGGSLQQGRVVKRVRSN